MVLVHVTPSVPFAGVAAPSTDWVPKATEVAVTAQPAVIVMVTGIVVVAVAAFAPSGTRADDSKSAHAKTAALRLAMVR